MLNGTQQQFVVRNSDLDGWTNGVWNQVFSGDVGAPAQNFASGGQYTTLATSPVTEEEPFLQRRLRRELQRVRAGGAARLGRDHLGRRPAPGPPSPSSGSSSPAPSTPVAQINAALALGKDLILTPGVYSLSQPIVVTRPDTVVLGLGFATLVPAARQRRDAVAGVRG